MRIAVLDDSQDVARDAADWSALNARADVTILREPFASVDASADALGDYDILIAMRERTAFPAALIERLPKLKMIALTGARSPSLDLAACTKAGVIVSNTAGIDVTASTSELAFALIMACARAIPICDATMRSGGWHDGVPLATILRGKRLGIVGLGRLGSQMAGYGKAFGMDVVAWSQNLTAEKAAEGGAALVSKTELFSTSDAITLHLVLSDRSRGIVGATEIDAMKPGAILVNTSRGPLIERAPLLAALREGRIRAGLDVYDTEPPSPDDPLRTAPNTVLIPHQGYSATPVFRQFYGESIENILAFLDGRPIRVVNPEALTVRA